jgi:uncharacterized protein (TIGR02284 family)
MSDKIKKLKELAQYEIDATFILAQAISTLKDQEARERLTQMREECENHIRTLSDLIVAQGGEAPEHTRDFKGFFMQGYTGMRGLMSDEGVMKALSSNTKMLVNAFEKALQEDIPQEVKHEIETILSKAEENIDYFSQKSGEL